MVSYLMALERLKNAGFKPATIIDGGAHVGRWAESVARLFPGAPVLLIDPLSTVRRDLEALSAATGWPFYPVGLGLQSANHVHFNAHGAQSSLFGNYDGAGWGSAESITITSLNRLVRESGCPGPYLLKLDIQGGELAALQGAVQILGETPVIQLEVSYIEFQKDMPLAHEIIAFLGGRGYCIYDVVDEIRREDGSLRQSDMIFVQTAAGLIQHRWEPGRSMPWS